MDKCPDAQLFGPKHSKFWVLEREEPVFVLCLETVSTETQYFGSGTRLTVLGKQGGGLVGFWDAGGKWW